MGEGIVGDGKPRLWARERIGSNAFDPLEHHSARIRLGMEALILDPGDRIASRPADFSDTSPRMPRCGLKAEPMPLAASLATAPIASRPRCRSSRRMFVIDDELELELDPIGDGKGPADRLGPFCLP